MERTSKQVVESLLERLASGRWNEPDYLLADMTDDAEWWVSGSLPISGTMDRQKMAETFGGAGQMSATGLTITPRSWVVDGDHVALEAESFMPLRDGREYRNQYHFAIKLENGKIRSVREYMDTHYAAEMFS